jgi:Ni,Fe-hydrogenase I cytochrome b subunit
MSKRFLLVVAHVIASLAIGLVLACVLGLGYFITVEYFWPFDPIEAAGPESARFFAMALIAFLAFMVGTVISGTALFAVFWGETKCAD